MTPTPAFIAALKSPLKRKRGGSKPFEAETRARLARLELLVGLLCLRVFGIIPGLGP